MNDKNSHSEIDLTESTSREIDGESSAQSSAVEDIGPAVGVAAESRSATKPIISGAQKAESVLPTAKLVESVNFGLAESALPTAKFMESVNFGLAESVLQTVKLVESVNFGLAESVLQTAKFMESVNFGLAESVLPTAKFMESVNFGLAESVLPTAKFMESVNFGLAESVLPTAKFMESVNFGLAESVLPTAKFMESVNFGLAESVLSTAQVLAQIWHARLREPPHFRENARFKEVEWFPHSTFPRHLLGSDTDDAYSDEAVLTYYRVNWENVKEAIEAELSQCQVSEEAKAAVHQALIAHEKGLYLLVPPALFTAIEGAVRVGLFENRVGRVSVGEQLVPILKKLPVSALPDGALGLVGVSNLSNHLYESIYTDAAREKFSGASIPNRHATIHALVIYSSEKSSLNAIFAAIYVLRSLTVLKEVSSDVQLGSSSNFLI